MTLTPDPPVIPPVRVPVSPPDLSIINARDCELAGFDLALVLEAAKAMAR